VRDNVVLIQNSELLTGILDKKAVGAGKDGNLVHLIWLELGPEASARFMHHV